MRKKTPGVGALLNFFLPGIGYAYAGKRIGFGIGIFIAMFLDYLWKSQAGYLNTQYAWIDMITSFIAAIFFAYDGYKTVEEVNLEISGIGKESVASGKDIYCRKCGSKNPSDSIYCQFCGTKIRNEK